MSTFQELCEAAFAGKIIQIRDNFSLPVEKWIDFTESAEQVVRRIAKHPDLVCRIKPDIKVIVYRIYLDTHHVAQVWRNIVSQVELESAPVFLKWIGDEQTIEVEV